MAGISPSRAGSHSIQHRAPGDLLSSTGARALVYTAGVGEGPTSIYNTLSATAPPCGLPLWSAVCLRAAAGGRGELATAWRTTWRARVALGTMRTSGGLMLATMVLRVVPLALLFNTHGVKVRSEGLTAIARSVAPGIGRATFESAKANAHVDTSCCPALLVRPLAQTPLPWKTALRSPLRCRLPSQQWSHTATSQTRTKTSGAFSSCLSHQRRHSLRHRTSSSSRKMSSTKLWSQSEGLRSTALSSRKARGLATCTAAA